jgi:Na+-driven multidrug efflux pump
MNRKAASLTINTLVVTILALLVLIVLAVAFRSQISSLFTSLGDLIKGTSDSLNNVEISEIVK